MQDGKTQVLMSEERLLYLDLQYFAKEGPGGEKTEEPTSKKLEDARDEGQVCKSMELNYAISLLAVFAVIKLWGITLATNFTEMIKWIFGNLHNFQYMNGSHVAIHNFVQLLNIVILRMMIMLLPIFVVGFIVAFVVNLVQVKWKVTAKPLQPKLSKFNPISGMKRLFSKEKLFELFKSILKVFLVVYVAWNFLKKKLGIIYLLYDYDLFGAVGLVTSTVVDLGIRISALYLIVGFIDYLFQKHKFHEDMKMTKQEVKDEYKNAEGDPQIKGQIRQKMREASRRRMMKSVPQADVVITNPTHFAVALKYDAEVADAPIVVAKGADLVARRIKEIAKENGVEIVENKPLARMLYANVEVGEMVPPELYQAVAEVLAFVYNLKKENSNAMSS